MAASDKLWFELGVRDEVSKVLTELIRKSKDVEDSFDKISDSIEDLLESAYNRNGKVSEVIDKLNNKLNGLEKERKVKIEVTSDASSIVDKIETNILELTQQLDILGKAIHKTLSLQTANPNDKTISSGLDQLTESYKKTEEQINALYVTLNKLKSVGTIDVSKSLGLEHVEQKWNATETATERHLTRQRELEAAFAEEDRKIAQDRQNQAKVEEILQMRRHKQKMEEASDEREVAAITNQVNREIIDKKKQKAEADRAEAEAAKKAEEAARNHANANRSLLDSYNKVSEAGSKTSTIIGQLNNQFAGYVSLYGIERLLKNIIQIGGEFEVQHIALQSILGDVQQANSMFEQMKELAVVSPFNFRQLATYSKQVAAFGIPYEEMYDTTKRLADMAAGLGVDMGRLILAYGQVRSAAVLRGQELRQFTEAGIPMVQALAQEFTKLNGRAVSTAEVFELISKRAVPFEMVKKVMWDMTNEGGRFFDMQFTLSDTLAGKWSNLQDAWEIMLSEFAKGESLSGQFLKSTVTLLTKLTETANTLMPILAGGGLFYMMKKVENSFAGMGLNGIDANIKKAQQLQAIELRRKLINQEISREQYNIGMAMNKSQARYYVMLANEGKLKNYQIQRLIVQNKINNARLQELVASKELTMREAAQIRLWRMKNGEISAFQMRMNGLWSGAKSFWKANAWMIAIDVAITALTTWYAKAEEAKEKNNELVNSFSNSAKEIKESYDSLKDDRLNSDDDYKSGIAGLKEQVKQHSENYEAILREANSLESLQEQYKYLKNVLYEESIITEKAEQKAEKFGEATRSAFEKANEAARYITTGRQSFWDVMFGADTDVQRGLDKSIKNLYEKILEVVPNVGKNERSNELYRKLRNSLEEQLGFGSKEKMLINIKLNELFHIDNIEDATTLVVDKFGDMLAKAEPQIANKIRYDSNNLNQAEKEKIAELVNEAVEETKSRYPYYANTLQQLLNDSKFVANIQLRFSTTGKNANDFQKWIYRNMDPYLDENIKNIATSWGESGNSFDAQNAAKRDIDSAKNELESRKKQTVLAQKNLDEAKKKKKSQDEINRLEEQEKVAAEREKSAKTLYENRKTAALQGLGYDYEGELKKSNREKNTPKGKDTKLEAIKNRVDLYKKFYTELESYTDLYGKAGALSKLRKDGEFGAVFGWDNVSDLTNYKKTIGELTSELNNNIEAHAKFLNTTKADIQARKRKEETEAIKNYISELQRMFSVMSENYQTYKKWLELTGDSELAARIAGVTQNTSLSDWLTDQMNNALKKTNFALSAKDVFGLSETQAKELGKDSLIFDIWKDWQENQKKIRNEQRDLYEEAYKGAKDYDDKIADINRDLQKHIDAVNTLAVSEEDRQKLINNLQKNAENQIGSVKWEKFKEENNWGEVFGNLEKMPLGTIRKMIDAMKEYGKVTKMDVNETKAWYEALDKLLNREMMLDPIKSLTKALEDYQTAHSKRLIIDQQIQRTKNDPELSEEQKKKIISALEKERVKLLNQEADALERVSGAIKAFSSYIKNLGTSLSQLGNKIGGSFGEIMNGVSGIFDNISSGMDSIAGLISSSNTTGLAGILGKVTSVLGIVTSVVGIVQGLGSILPSTQSIYEKYAEKAREVNNLREAVDDYRISVAKARAEESEWFAGNSLSALRANGDKAKETLSAYYKELYENQEPYEPKGSGLARWAVPIAAAVAGIALGVVTGGAGFAASFGIIGSAVTSGIATGLIAEAIGVAVVAGVSSAVGQIAQSAYESITYKDGEIDARRNMFIQTQHSSFWRGEKVQNLEEWARENLKDKYGKPVELFDKEGLVNLEAAEQILEKYGNKLVGDTQETLQRLVDLRKEYDEFINQIQDYASQIGTSLADNMTDALWDWLSDGENALDKFREYASDTWKQIAQDIIKTFYKVTVLDKYAEVFESLFKEWGLGGISDEQLIEKFATLSGMIVNDFETATPMGEKLATMLKDMFELQGYDITNQDGGRSSSSREIKNVTENTAGLIASYLNSVRADTSVNRMTLSQILIAVQTQVDMPVIARAQLQQLQVIAGNTGRNVEIVDSIYNLLHALAPDGTAIRIK